MVELNPEISERFQIAKRCLLPSADTDAQLRHSQKMEAVGQLAGGIAHDFNNLLTIIIGCGEVLRAQVEESSEQSELLEEIRRAADRAVLLTRQLLAFSRRQVLEPKIIHFNDVVCDMGKMLRRLIGEDIEIRTILDPALEKVLADRGQVEQVILNLALNARDAMPDGGELSIETRNADLDQDYLQSHAEVLTGRYVMLAVSDSGRGMDPATKARIFEPFFTTKDAGKGTGLGLATVYGIVKQSGGHVWVYSELGQGSTFKVYLPAIQESIEIRTENAAPGVPVGGDETVPLVEDEASVRSISRAALQTYGYTVLEAGGPLEAIELSRAHVGDIAVLVTDVVMPQLNGRRLAELLQPERPEMRVLYVSGYTDDTIVRQGVLENEVHFLQKPYTPGSLAETVRAVLESGAA